MYKKILETYALDPKNPTSLEKETATYLDGIALDERLEKGTKFQADEMRQIYKDILAQYFEGKRSQEFVIWLGDILYPLVFGGDVIDPDEELLGIACRLDDLSDPSTNILSRDEADVIFREIQVML